MDWLLGTWPWYVSGPLIGLTVPLLLLFVGESFGISSSLRHICSMCLPRTKIAYLQDNDWRGEAWNLFFVLGIVGGSALALHLFSDATNPLLPEHYRHWPGWVALFAGGVLVGFGTRYAAGCTSSHAIMGLSSLKWVSLVATISFFIGGLAMTGLVSILSR